MITAKPTTPLSDEFLILQYLTLLTSVSWRMKRRGAMVRPAFAGSLIGSGISYAGSPFQFAMFQ